MNIDDIKKISLVEFLNQLGYQPTGRDSKGLWFYAPYRSEENRRSMSIHGKICGLTFGTGAGGDIFSLAGEMSGETDFLTSRLHRGEDAPPGRYPLSQRPLLKNLPLKISKCRV